MAWIDITAARKLHAAIVAIAPYADVRSERHPLDDTARVIVSMRDPNTGNSAADYATHDTDPDALVARLKKELYGRAKKTRAAISAENRPT